MYIVPEKITVATVNGSSHSTAEDLVKIFAETLAIEVTLATVSTIKEAQEVPFNRLLLLGGSDISPALYGEDVSHSVFLNQHRDNVEVTLMKRAMDEEIPTLGICRGHQMIAAAYGGTLWQDFGKEVGTDHGWKHRLVDVIDPLAKFLPIHTVNSFHHQSVKEVPEGFSVLARASDGIIESIGKPGCVGVQFHPEMMIENDESWTPLFCWFLLDSLRWDVA